MGPDPPSCSIVEHAGPCQSHSELQANATLLKQPRLEQNKMTAKGNQIILPILHSLEIGQAPPHESSMLNPSLSDN